MPIPSVRDRRPTDGMSCEERVELYKRLNLRMRAWIDDLQSGMYVNCVYCGHRYGPNETTPVTMADALKEHIEVCPDHPMSALKAEIEKVPESDIRMLMDVAYQWGAHPASAFALAIDRVERWLRTLATPESEGSST